MIKKKEMCKILNHLKEEIPYYKEVNSDNKDMPRDLFMIYIKK